MDANFIFWILVAVVTGAVEGATMALVSVWFCAGAVAAAITAVITPSVPAQCTVFVIATGVMLAVTRPIARRLTNNTFTPTNADRVIGGEGVVIKEIDPVEGTGQVMIGGQVWSAKSDSRAKIEKGTAVTVLKIAGVHVIVQPKEEK